MKRILIITILVMAVALFSCKKDKKAQNFGIVNFLSGKVTLVIKDKSVKAKVKDLIKEGTQIITGKKSFVDIYIGKNGIKILENTKVTFTKLMIEKITKKENTELHLSQGKIFTKITRKLSKGESYKINTPTTTAGVRGTDFLLAQDKGKSTVSCVDGKVRVERNDDKKYVDLNKGQEVSVEKGKELTVASIKADNLRMINQIRKDFKQMRDDIIRQQKELRDKVFDDVKKVKEQSKRDVQEVKDKTKKEIKKIKEDVKGMQDDIKKGTGDTGKKTKSDVDKLKNSMQNIQKFDTDVNKTKDKKKNNTMDSLGQ